jgi:DNA repair exonuclease SbcCD nuclease subunit
MKKRFLIVGDNHLDSKTPENRIDNFLESGMMELRETLQIAKAAQVDYFILLGDVFDRLDVGGVCRNKALSILTSDEGAPWPFEKYVVVGNHDIAHKPTYLENSALGSLIASGCVKKCDTIDKLPVRFFHFYPELDEDLRQNILTRYSEKIYFCHASIVDKPSRFDHVLFSDLKFNDEAKMIVSGHIHAPMVSEKNGVKFFNPGSLGRTKIDEKHTPQVLLIQYDFSNDTIQHKYLKLKNSLSHDIVFDIDRSMKKKAEEKNTELFIDSATNVDISDNITGDINEDLIKFAEKIHVDKKVVDEVINAINIIKTGGYL